MEQVILKADRELIDKDFQGYKLSLATDHAIYKRNVISNINDVKLNENFYSIQHVGCFAMFNHLHMDTWNPNHVYYITDDLSIYQVKSSAEKLNLEEGRNVYKFPKDYQSVFRLQSQEDDENSPSLNYNAVIHFINEELVIASNGSGTLFLLQTGNRSQDLSWREVFSSSEFGSRRPFLLVDACLKSLDSSKHIECVLLRIEDKSNVTETVEGNDNSSTFTSVLEWVTLSSKVDGSWEISRISRLQGCGTIDYAAVDPNYDCLWVASNKRFSFVYDSQKTVEPVNSSKKKDSVERKPIYAWKQGLEDATVWLQLDEKTDKSDIEMTLSLNHISLRLLTSTKLDGQLFAPIDVDGSTWTIDDNKKLEITLSKLNQGLMWRELIKGDDRGEEILDAELMQQIHERLAHLTSDTLNPDPQVQKLGDFNLDQLEECDDFPEHSFSLMKFDRSTLKSTHEVSLSSHNWLFHGSRWLNELPRLCVRYDVDGLLCIPNSEKGELTHVNTFNALGYVSASKQDKKFMSCAPDASFAVLADSKKHLYVYFQPTLIENELRNRKTGQKVKEVAKQKLITLENSDILGLRVSDSSVFVLSREHIYEIKLVETQ